MEVQIIRCIWITVEARCERDTRGFLSSTYSPLVTRSEKPARTWDSRGQAETESIRINGWCRHTQCTGRKCVLNIDLVINRPNKYGKPQCSADNIKGIISSQPNLFHQCLCPFDLCVANALRDLKKVNNYRFFLLMFYSLWNLVLCIANKLRDLKKVFFIFCV